MRRGSVRRAASRREGRGRHPRGVAGAARGGTAQPGPPDRALQPSPRDPRCLGPDPPGCRTSAPRGGDRGPTVRDSSGAADGVWPRAARSGAISGRDARSPRFAGCSRRGHGGARGFDVGARPVGPAYHPGPPPDGGPGGGRSCPRVGSDSLGYCATDASLGRHRPSGVAGLSVGGVESAFVSGLPQLEMVTIGRNETGLGSDRPDESDSFLSIGPPGARR
jgi:hypothetical protein